MTCVDCHATHAPNQTLVPHELEQMTVCQTCHNPTGLASTMTEVNVHSVDGDTVIIDCGSCHDAHGPHTTTDPHTASTALNLSLIRADTSKYVLGALEPAIFQDRSQHFAFGAGNPPWVGVCETCHQSTTYHTQDDSGDHSHYLAYDCTDCHTHLSGFSPVVSCDACHDEQTGAHQAHLTGDTYRAPLTCDDCHPVPQTLQDGSHLNGTVEVEFPADGPAWWDGNNPVWDGSTCQAVFCHGATLTQGTHTQPAWTDTGIGCGWCHVETVPNHTCADCHSVDFLPGGELDHDRHLNGALDFHW